MSSIRARSLALVIVGPMVLVLHAQIDSTALVERSYGEATRMCEAFQSGRFDTFIDLTHPKIVRWAGGREAMKAAVSQGSPDGDRLLDTRVERCKKLFVSGDTVQCAMRQRQEMLFDGKRYSTLGDLIGISYDAGVTWSFIGVAGKSLHEIRKQFPEVNAGLEVWPQTPPRLIE